MPTTANYSWPTPADTDLVKNGADAMRDLGDAIDTTVKSVSDGRGLVHINTYSFTTSSAESLNNIFNSTYDFYRIMIDITTSALVNVNLRLRASGTDASGSNYTFQQLTAGGTSVTGQRLSSQTTLKIGTGVTTLSNRFRLDVFEPFKAEATGFIVDMVNSNSSAEIEHLYGNHSLTTSYDGVTIYPASGTMTGQIRVYGYKN